MRIGDFPGTGKGRPLAELHFTPTLECVDAFRPPHIIFWPRDPHALSPPPARGSGLSFPRMSARAASFLARGENPARVARTLGETLRGIARPSGAMLFVSGDLSLKLGDLAERVQEVAGPIPVLIAAGHGVLTERGEVEGETAAAGLVWTGGETIPIPIDDATGPDLGVTLADALEPCLGPAATAFVFVRPRGVLPHTLDPLKALRCAALVGAGTSVDDGVVVIRPGERPRIAQAGALVLRGITPPVVRSSPACRLLTPLTPITATRGPMVLEIGGEHALEVLSIAASELKDQPLLFVVLAEEADDGDDEDAESPPLLLRGIQGVDPLRQGILVSEEVRPGLRMAFAVRDAAAARSDLEAIAARLSRETAGAAPRFGVYVSCAGRGASLYGAQDVDTRVIRARFPDLPLVGLHSSFEIAPHGGSPALQLYTGVLTLFTVPS